MTTPDCWARTILARWYKFVRQWKVPATAVALAAVLAVAGTADAQAKSASRKRATAKKAAPRRAVPRPPAHDLGGLVRAYRESPTPARRAAVTAWAAAHPKDRDLAKLGLGVAAFEQRGFAGAIEALKPLAARFPQLPDYIGYYTGAAHVELNGMEAARRDLAAAHRAPVASPLEGKAWIAESRALLPSNPAGAAQLLRVHYRQLPQPDGDMVLGAACRAANELAHAAEAFQRVYYEYPASDAAQRAGTALAAIRDTLGSQFPPPTAELMLHRGDRLLEAREYARARREFEKLTTELGGIGRDRARVRIAAVDLWSGKASAAFHHLMGLETAASDADAERLYFLVESARRLREDGDMLKAVEALGKRYPKSSWRAKALVSAGNRYLLTNEPDQYVPLYQALYENFPDHAQAPFCHWRVTFAGYMRDRSGAPRLLRDHVQYFPWHPTSAAALYFLGRHAETTGAGAEARVFYSRIRELFPNQYYGVLARERLTEMRVAGGTEKASQFLAAVAFPPRKAPVMEAAPASMAHIERARLLRRAGLPELAATELRFGARNGGQPVLLGMELATSADAIHQGLRIIKSFAPEYLNLPLESLPRSLWDLLFPMPFKDGIVSNAEEHGVDAYVLAGLIRQESEFNPQALSPAKAYGLTQVRPPTGRMYARKAGLKRLTAAMLFQPATNLKVGTVILRSMYDSNGGKWERTLASYNAGPNRVVLWQTWYRYREPAEFVETIPITETREYVQAVLRNADLYRRLYERRSGGPVAAAR